MAADPDILAELEERIGYRFRDRALLVEALTHRSVLNELPSGDHADNERLEFMGDAVLGLLVGELLFERHAGMREGELSRLRSALVREDALAALARSLELGRFLVMGKGEERTGGRERDSNLADAYEAVIAAVFRDGGFDAARQIVRAHISPRVESGSAAGSMEDFKTRLQELVQGRGAAPPVYRLVTSEGPDHERVFTVEVRIDGKVQGEGTGTSRKRAEQEAARAVLDRARATTLGEGRELS